MYPNPNQLLEMQKSNVDAVQAIGSAMFQAAEKLSKLTLDAGRGLLQDSASAAQSLMSAKDPQEVSAIAGSLAQPGAEKMAAFSRSAYTIASAAGADLGRIFEAQVAESNRKIAEAIEAAAKAAPAGSEPAFSFVRNSLSAANTAFDVVARAARQAGETAETNIAAAVAAATDVVKTKPKKTA